MMHYDALCISISLRGIPSIAELLIFADFLHNQVLLQVSIASQAALDLLSEEADVR